MFVQCKAFVLRTFKHTDRSSIVRCYTDKFGLRSYIIRPSKKLPKALFRPLTLLDMAVQERSDQDLQKVKEVMLVEAAPGQDGNMYKSTLSLFIQEFLIHAIRSEEADKDLFDLIHRTCMAVNGNPGPWSGHQFMVAMGTQMGIIPPPPEEHLEWFDLELGEYTPIQPKHIHCFGSPWSHILPQLQDSVLGMNPSIVCSSEERREMLDRLLVIFRYHTQSSFELKSPEILREVLS